MRAKLTHTNTQMDPNPSKFQPPVKHLPFRCSGGSRKVVNSPAASTPLGTIHEKLSWAQTCASSTCVLYEYSPPFSTFVLSKAKTSDFTPFLATFNTLNARMIDWLIKTAQLSTNKVCEVKLCIRAEASWSSHWLHCIKEDGGSEGRSRLRCSFREPFYIYSPCWCQMSIICIQWVGTKLCLVWFPAVLVN